MSQKIMVLFIVILMSHNSNLYSYEIKGLLPEKFTSNTINKRYEALDGNYPIQAVIKSYLEPDDVINCLDLDADLRLPGLKYLVHDILTAMFFNDDKYKKGINVLRILFNEDFQLDGKSPVKHVYSPVFGKTDYERVLGTGDSALIDFFNNHCGYKYPSLTQENLHIHTNKRFSLDFEPIRLSPCLDDNSSVGSSEEFSD